MDLFFCLKVSHGGSWYVLTSISFGLFPSTCPLAAPFSFLFHQLSNLSVCDCFCSHVLFGYFRIRLLFYQFLSTIPLLTFHIFYYRNSLVFWIKFEYWNERYGGFKHFSFNFHSRSLTHHSKSIFSQTF